MDSTQTVATQTPRYLLNEAMYDSRDVYHEKDTEYETDEAPAWYMEPLNDAARAQTAKYKPTITSMDRFITQGLKTK